MSLQEEVIKQIKYLQHRRTHLSHHLPDIILSYEEGVIDVCIRICHEFLKRFIIKAIPTLFLLKSLKNCKHDLV
jgi:hypothetical protein